MVSHHNTQACRNVVFWSSHVNTLFFYHLCRENMRLLAVLSTLVDTPKEARHRNHHIIACIPGVDTGICEWRCAICSSPDPPTSESTVYSIFNLKLL